jgi:predicted RNase H-like HicB family nuclease
MLCVTVVPASHGWYIAYAHFPDGREYLSIGGKSVEEVRDRAYSAIDNLRTWIG